MMSLISLRTLKKRPRSESCCSCSSSSNSNCTANIGHAYNYTPAEQKGLNGWGSRGRYHNCSSNCNIAVAVAAGSALLDRHYCIRQQCFICCLPGATRDERHTSFPAVAGAAAVAAAPAGTPEGTCGSVLCYCRGTHASSYYRSGAAQQTCAVA